MRRGGVACIQPDTCANGVSMLRVVLPICCSNLLYCTAGMTRDLCMTSFPTIQPARQSIVNLHAAIPSLHRSGRPSVRRCVTVSLLVGSSCHVALADNWHVQCNQALYGTEIDGMRYASLLSRALHPTCARGALHAQCMDAQCMHAQCMHAVRMRLDSVWS